MELGGTSPAEVAHVAVSILEFSSIHPPAPSTAHGSRHSRLGSSAPAGPGSRAPGAPVLRTLPVQYSILLHRSLSLPLQGSASGSEKRTRSRENTQDAGAFAAGKVKLLRFSSGFDRRASLLEVPCISHTPYQEGSFFFWLNARGAACGLMTSCRSLRRIQQLTSRRLRAAYDQLSSYSDS
jgi:hypothetical protein